MPGVIGETFKDKHGRIYHYCTGYEGQNRMCWWCGQPFESKRSRHCCCPEHTGQYEKHFAWGPASRWAMERANNTCQRCGRIQGYSERTTRYFVAKSDIEVHHIIPLNGGHRDYNVLNCPCNLLCLCLECHGETRQTKKRQAEARGKQLAMELAS